VELGTVPLLVEKGADVKAKGEVGQTALYLAAHSREEVAARLLTRLQDVETNEKDGAGPTPLSLAAANGNEMIVRLLLE
jgi:ankyrin repeat protein